MEHIGAHRHAKHECGIKYDDNFYAGKVFRMVLRPLCSACFTSLGSTQAVAADEWVLGRGGADLLDNVRKEAVAVLLEYHSDPFHTQNWSQFSWMATAKLDTTANHFIGFGVHALAPLNNKKAFLEANFAVGG